MIKASFEALNPFPSHSFLLREFSEFATPYHFHPEYELTLIVRGSGSRYVGDHMGIYGDGDLVLIGSNLPHCWKNNPSEDPDTTIASVVIQFSADFLGADFLGLPELSEILMLLQRSAHGIQFTGDGAAKISALMVRLKDEEIPFKRLMGMLDMLYVLSQSKEYHLLDQRGESAQQTGDKAERISTILGYIIDNYQGEIQLDKAAATVNMTSNAFCKYYKKTTGKTFIETVTDYRINYAIQQLVHSDKSISDICFSNGFGDLSHFYKLFKRKMMVSPLNYRKKFRQGLICLLLVSILAFS
ncbi:AraC-like DNA-binding protein [Pedobacter sp. UYP24]